MPTVNTQFVGEMLGWGALRNPTQQEDNRGTAITGLGEERRNKALYKCKFYMLPFMKCSASVNNEPCSQQLPNKACTGRLGLCAFLGIVLSYGGIPFSSFFLSSRR
jgi:hypothetical protein